MPAVIDRPSQQRMDVFANSPFDDETFFDYPRPESSLVRQYMT
jgi:hypothetical protein